MTAQERLAAALDAVSGVPGDLPISNAGYETAGSVYLNWNDAEGAAAVILAADPHLAQDIADGEALRRLREALPDGWKEPLITIQWYVDEESGPGWSFGVQDATGSSDAVTGYLAGYFLQRAPTLTDAADKVREALERRS